MGIRSTLGKPFAAYVVKNQQKWAKYPYMYQQKIFKRLMSVGKNTVFGKDHGLTGETTYQAFKKQVPIRDYEGLKPYVEQVFAGASDVMWKGKPIYFIKTSGTTSGPKYIPITKESMPYFIQSARDSLLNYVHETGNAKFLDGKLIYFSGSPILFQKGGINTGRLSGIVTHHIPGYLRSNQLPTYKINCIEDWEEKIDRIVEETIGKNLSLISGIPPWVQMYFDTINKKTGKPLKDIFPNFSLFVHGGVNFEPYKKKFHQAIGKQVDAIETYPSSEGFIAYQDTRTEEGLLLLLNHGIFYEFIPVEEYFKENPTRLPIEDVELGVNYALIINSTAGLWGYSIGDTVKFVNKEPYRLLVTGRIKHFISAFGEHVIGTEVEIAMKLTMEKFTEVTLVEFTVAAQVNPEEGLPLHEWYIEFTNAPNDLTAFEKELNLQLQKLNFFYDDLVNGSILRGLKVIMLQKNSFVNYMKSLGKLGGQNKVPRLSNDRKIAKELIKYKLES